jgi:membrane associated rhomboid family serine protease
VANHLQNRRKYLVPTIVAMLVAVAVSLYYGDVQNVPSQNLQRAIFAVMILTALAACFWSNVTLQRLAAIIFFLGGVLFFVIGDPVLVSG